MKKTKKPTQYVVALKDFYKNPITPDEVFTVRSLKQAKALIKLAEMSGYKYVKSWEGT